MITIRTDYYKYLKTVETKENCKCKICSYRVNLPMQRRSSYTKSKVQDIASIYSNADDFNLRRLWWCNG